MSVSKRSRASDAVHDKVTHVDEERVKRRRFSQVQNGNKKSQQLIAPEVKKGSIDRDAVLACGGAPARDLGVGKTSRAPWSLVNHVAGQYSDLDPIFTTDEEYLFLGLETSVHVYSMATSRLFRSMNLQPGHNIIGYRLCPFNQEHLYIFTSTGSVSLWEWSSGKQIWSSDVCGQTTAIDISFDDESESNTHITVYSIRERKDGKREIAIAIGEEKLRDNVVFETNLRISDLKIAHQGRTIVAYGAQHLLVGTANTQGSNDSKHMHYVWRETTLPVNITCVDIRETAVSTRLGSQSSKDRKNYGQVDLVLGESNGSILIYNDVLSFFLTNEDGRETGKNLTPRRLHWHRGSVNTVRWSSDGNYVISGGHESVMVLWQLDTGRKQFLPHLSSPICNIVVSPTGNSYVVKLADNCIMVLSARELQPSATIVGLQLCPKLSRPLDKSSSITRPFLTSAAAAALHPQQPDQLLIAVPASRQVSQDGHHLPNSSVLQTYDIRTNSHISRQALARTNATTLRISPEGSEIVAPDIRLMGLCQDGKWMSTVDAWSPYPKDVKALDISNTGSDGRAADYQEVFLKFWKWNNFTSLWELVTRIDGPHFSAKGHLSILSLTARPQGHEFVTIGSDAMLRFWCPSIRQRSGLKTGPEAGQQLETWKCRNSIDLKGRIGNKAKHLSAACLDFSEDGSVLAVCLPSQSPSSSGLVILVDAQNCTVHYSRVGMFWGNPCATRFIGRYLVVASKHAVSVWDTVDDLVKTTGSPELADQFTNEESLLLAVNPQTQTFAVATQLLQKHGHSSKKLPGAEFHLRIYDVQSLAPYSQFMLHKCPLALLSNPHTSGYVVVDATANVKRFSSLDKGTETTSQSHELPAHLNPGLVDLFGAQTGGSSSRQILPTTNTENSTQSKSLANIFGVVPSFALPSANVLFKSVVQSLS